MKNKLLRIARLIVNFAVSALIFNFFVLSLILILNPATGINQWEFARMYLQLLLFFGLGWFAVTLVLFLLIQIMSSRKYHVGIFWPPTLTYFLNFTILIVSLIYYLNYDYYLDLFSPDIKSFMIKILIICLILIITGVFFLISRGSIKKWIQLVFLALLLYSMAFTFSGIVSMDLPSLSGSSEPQYIQEVTPRKIRIIIAEGLSYKTILSLSSDQSLPNFNYLIQNGVQARISSFKPNLSLSQLNTMFTGQSPYNFKNISQIKFKIGILQKEFNIFPRFVFFRYSSNLRVTTFYKKFGQKVADFIQSYYQFNHYTSKSRLSTDYYPIYSEKSLTFNRRFKPLFAPVLNQQDSKFEILKKSFFFDDYLKNCIPELKDSHLYYSTNRLTGLANVSRYFFQYHNSSQFESIPPEERKKYSWILEKYYEYYDSIVGNLLSTTGENELLIIISPFEYEPLPVWRRVLLSFFGKKDVYAYKSLNSRGTIFLYEKSAIKRGYPLKTISIYDIFPTLLYYSGFQLDRNLQGEVVREIFTDEFLLNNPVDIRTPRQ